MKKLLLPVIALGIAVGMNSCYTDPDPGIGIVTILDGQDFRVPTAYVRLSQPGQLGTGQILVEGYTDIQGEFLYTHAPALEVILNVDAIKDGKIGKGIIRVKPGETTRESIKIY